MTDYQKTSKKDAAKPDGSEQTPKDRPEIHKIVTGEVVVPKKSLGEKFKDTFFDGTFFKGLVHNAYRNVILPNAKHILFDTGMELLKGGIYRNGNARQVLNPQSLVSRFSYQTPVNRSGYPSSGYPSMTPMGPMHQAPAVEIGPRMSSRNNKRIYLCRTRQEAEDVLESMTDIINSDYKFVAVGEVHEMLGLEMIPSDYNWGWFSIGDARITADRDGYILELPQPEAL